MFLRVIHHNSTLFFSGNVTRFLSISFTPITISQQSIIMNTKATNRIVNGRRISAVSCSDLMSLDHNGRQIMKHDTLLLVLSHLHIIHISVSRNRFSFPVSSLGFYIDLFSSQVTVFIHWNVRSVKISWLRSSRAFKRDITSFVIILARKLANSYFCSWTNKCPG